MNPDSPDPSQDVVSNALPDAATPDQTSPQAAQPQSSPNPAQSQPNAPTSSAPLPSSTATVSNAPSGTVGPTAGTTSPLVKHASVINEVARTLAGNPTRTVIDPQTGATTREPASIPTSKLWLAVALQALGGAALGLSQTGPNAAGKAAALGFQQGQQQVQQRQQTQDAQAQADSKAQAAALSAKALNFEIASRVLLNTSQAERAGVESLQSAVQSNAKLLADYDDQGNILERNVTQDDLSDRLAKGQISATSEIALPDGFTNINGKYEQTFALVNSPSAKVPLSNAQVQEFGNAGIPGFTQYRNGATTIPEGFLVNGAVVARANGQLQGLNLMRQDVAGVIDTLSKSDDKGNHALAQSVPDLQTYLDDPKKGAGLFASLQRFQRYLSHSGPESFADSLAHMAQPSKPDPNDPKKVVPNPDAPFAQSIYGYLGGGDPAKGKAILSAYSSEVSPLQIHSEGEAADMLASSEPGSRSYVYAQNWIRSNTAQKVAIVKAEKEKTGVNAPGNPGLINSTPANGVNEQYIRSLPLTQQSIVRSIGEGRQEGPNTRTAQGQALSQMVNNAYPDYDGTRFHTYQAMQKDFVSGKSSQGLVALNTALSHLQTVYDSANLGSTLPGISGLERLGGNTQAVALKAAQTAVTDELGRAYKAGVVSESERKEWQSLLDGWTPANVKQNATAFAHLLDGKLTSYEQTLRNGAPSGAVRLPALMSPQAAAAYTHMTGEAPVTSVGGTQPRQQESSQQPTASSFSKITTDGKMGWNGSQWVAIPTGGK